MTTGQSEGAVIRSWCHAASVPGGQQRQVEGDVGGGLRRQHPLQQQQVQRRGRHQRRQTRAVLPH